MGSVCLTTIPANARNRRAVHHENLRALPEYRAAGSPGPRGGQGRRTAGRVDHNGRSPHGVVERAMMSRFLAGAGVAIGVAGLQALQPGAMAQPVPPRLEFAFEVRAEVADPTVIGELPTGTRRIVDILGGTFEGPRLRGTLLPGGADWQIVRADGFTEVDARYTLRTESGRLIYVSNVGIRHAPPDVIRRLNAGEAVDPSQVYFRTVPRFETAAPDLQWLMRSIFIATGERYPKGVIIRYWRVL